jgi:2-polyprenyl-3-methyl-5-hydroxy-6-metoxy-1,4-benzoquinol methylase
MALGNLLPRILRKLRYELLLAPRGYGKLIPPERWDQMYRDGAWEHLNEIEEIGHYALIIGYLRFYFDKPKVLDVGCGHGRLLQLLDPHFHDYTGIDISSEAIKTARNLNLSGAQFLVNGFEDFVPEGKFDVIIFNESVGYAERPADLVRAYCDYLLPGGKLIISQFASGNYRAVWRSIAGQAEFVTGGEVRNDRGQMWSVKVFQPNPIPRTGLS